MFYNLKKAILYLRPSGVLLARHAVTEIVSGSPLPKVKTNKHF